MDKCRLSLLRQLKHIPRKPFNSQFDINNAKLFVSDSINFQHDYHLVTQFVRIFANYGFVILQCDNHHQQSIEKDVKNNQLLLQYLFGSRSEQQVEILEKFYPPQGCEHFSPPNHVTYTAPHTENAYSIDPPKIITLGSVIPSKSGGETILVSGQSLINHIYKLFDICCCYHVGFQRLFDNDCAIIYKLSYQLRWKALSIGTRKHIFKSNQFVTQHEKKNVIELCFPHKARVPAPDLKDNIDYSLPYFEQNIHLDNLWSKMEEFVFDSDNQLLYKLEPNEIAVIDNCSIFHGNAIFEENEMMVMKRVNFENNDEKGLLYNVLQHGADCHIIP
eukprot:342808_1